MFNPVFAKQGYATEALLAFMPRLFERMGHAENGGAEVGGAGCDYALANVDWENRDSIRLLERCGWTRGEFTEDAYTSPMLGLRSDFTYRIARPGLELGDVFKNIEDAEDQPFVPDLQ